MKRITLNSALLSALFAGLCGIYPTIHPWPALPHLHAQEQPVVAATLETIEKTPTWRVPIDVCWLADNVFTANSKTGSITRIDDHSGTVSHEWKVANQLAGLDVAANQLIALDNGRHRAIVLDFDRTHNGLSVRQEIPIPFDPVSLKVSEHQHVAIASRWSHQVTLLSPTDDHGWQRIWTVDLNFAPHTMLFVPNNKLIVCDAFQGQTAIVDVNKGQVLNSPQLHGHNIRGLCLSADGQQLHVTHQNLNDETFTSYERVFWGVVMQNGMETRQLNEFLTASAAEAGPAASGHQSGSYGSGSYDSNANYSARKLNSETTSLSSATMTSVHTYPLGTPSVGSGDPSEMTITKTDTTLLLLSGFNQVAYRTASHLPFSRLKVGKRPEAICLNTEQTRAYVVNRFDDSVTVISLEGESPQTTATISLGPTRELTEAERGEQLFFDASLSLDGWYSCHSCHTDGHTNGMLADTLGDEGQGAPKKVLSLLGTRDTAPWAWTGGKAALEDQIQTSLIISMQTTLRSDELPIRELAAYLRTLDAPPSVMTARSTSPPAAQIPNQQLIQAGRHEFEAQGCVHCHAGSEFTSDGTYEVGLSDNMGNTQFNPPSLRGVSQRTRYFHDGSAESLDDVLNSNHHRSDTPLTPQQVEVLKNFLESI